MRSVGGEEGLDLTQDIKPPKSLYIEVSARLVVSVCEHFARPSFFREFHPHPKSEVH